MYECILEEEAAGGRGISYRISLAVDNFLSGKFGMPFRFAGGVYGGGVVLRTLLIKKAVKSAFFVGGHVF